MNQFVVHIMMATFNGQNYLREQLDSLLAQSHNNWQLWVRDDGSTDNTIEILKTYEAKYPNIFIITNNKERGGACSNFAALFRMARLDEDVKYVMFCDQDDVWKPEKIETTLNEMRQQERLYPGKPVMIYSDLELIDQRGRATGHALRLKDKVDLKNLLTFNYVLGCTMMINRQMISKINCIPALAANHDYWIALVASIYHSSYINKKLIQYRQHTQNVSGNVSGNNSLSTRFRRHIVKPEYEICASKAKLIMLNEFYKYYADLLGLDKKIMLEKYLNAFNSGRLQVCYLILKYQMFKKGFFQSLMTFYQVIFFFDRITEGLWT